MLVTSRLSDRIGRRPILLTASIGLVLFSWPLFQLMRTGEVFYVFLGQLGFTLLIGPYNSINPIVLCEIFPRHVRCSAVSAAYNLSFGLAGGTAPAVVTWLIEFDRRYFDARLLHHGLCRDFSGGRVLVAGRSMLRLRPWTGKAS